MLHRKSSRSLKLSLLSATFAVFVLVGGCGRSEPENKVTYTPVPGAVQDQEQRLSSAAQQPGAGTSGAPAAKPDDPMNDPELARKGRDILQRTGGDVNKMTPKEKETFLEAAKNGHL